MSRANATPADIRTSAGVRHPLRALREAVQILRPIAEEAAQRRLRVALAFVASGAVLAAAALAFELAVDSLAQGAGAGGVVLATSLAFLTSVLDAARAFIHSHTEQRARRQVERRPAPRGELIFEAVTFSYREARAVLRDVSFTVPAGKTVALVGLGSSDKSSLIRLLFRLFEPDAGRILLDGTPIRDLSLSALRQGIAVVPQDTVLFNDTIASNIGLGRAGASLLEIKEAARVAGLHELISSWPHGYDTAIGERGVKLSVGERQRVAIARAALKKPRLFVFDAAIASLDAKTEGEIRRNLLGVSARGTTLAIAHRLSMIVQADEIVVLDGGVILERGTHTQLCALKGAYAALWRAQQGGVSQREELPTSAAQG